MSSLDAINAAIEQIANSDYQPNRIYYFDEKKGRSVIWTRYKKKTKARAKHN